MSTHPADWYPDPSGRFQHRYWDGTSWTEHVATNGEQTTDPVGGPATTVDAPGAGGASPTLDAIDRGLTVGDEGRADRIREQVSGTGYRGVGMTAPAAGGGGTIFDEPVLVVNQKAKLIELNNQYGVYDQHGTQVAAVNQVGQSTAKKLLRLVSDLDQFMTHKLQVTDRTGQVLLQITRPAKLMKSTVVVENGAGQELGRVVQQNMIGKINFSLESRGQTLGHIKAENWRAWNFRIEDTGGREIARITKTWEGLARTMFTTADNYVVQIAHRAPEPLNSLIVASALSVDTALKQDNRGIA